MKFLTAHWKHLLLANYNVQAALLEPFVPKGTQIDAFEGQIYVSLVAFMFEETRLAGIPIPFHRHFEEVNLRFYVSPKKDPSIRAVTFIKELVPRRIIPLIANNLFHETYAAVPMDHGNDPKRHWYSWQNASHNRFAANIDSELVLPPAGSLGEFITEHYWGYSQGPRRTLQYEVRHPQWRCCQIEDFEIDVDFAATYGEAFAFLNTQTPANVQYAEGSAVSVSFPSQL
ncbi:hypothetical protein Poly24_01970 [Rosistilla carotiformis]|uniref:DUF2071 domain-containing protein n=1 Tax=Rosistilla carotiformis TaxID=2528017 RepID=A0A518JLT3_9BACT|nr:DUF2071 domain-containing protein [Rosistilla carotiformis]QDV66511.1 hypothetical protein Poly24_01970 [Rosistilla carotiformis]